MAVKVGSHWCQFLKMAANCNQATVTVDRETCANKLIVVNIYKAGTALQIYAIAFLEMQNVGRAKSWKPNADPRFSQC